MSSPYLPPEILNYIINLVRNGRALRECCLVFKPSVLCTRRRIFTDIKFHPAGCLESWEKTFPDPADSLTYRPHVLWDDCPQAVKAADTEEGDWIRAFSASWSCMWTVPHRTPTAVDGQSLACNSYRDRNIIVQKKKEPRRLVPSGPVP